MPNGNTLICSGTDSTVFEVTPKKEIVWKFVNESFSPARDTGGGLFRSYRYGINHPAFKGKLLIPGKKIEDL